ncbi:MAG: hypothetical protein M1818_003714 [Claussenomyces sp. TS43310]|nr:MAG: hypothetical protein M1818_003714 [Claussenomyces sp. TS43310]
MAAVLQRLFGGSTPSPSPVPAGDADFADFAGAPSPEPASFSAIPSAASSAGPAATATGVPYTKWYNVHERYTLNDFRSEGLILLFVLVVVLVHLWGTRANRTKAKSWASAHAPVLEKEFAKVGFGDLEDPAEAPGELLNEKAAYQFSTYATGRQNVAFVDINLSLLKRYNPLVACVEYVTGFFFESMPAPVEKMEAVLYPFDGKEALTVPGLIPGALEVRKDAKSSYDGFVWAIVNKDSMKLIRDERYDVSLTSTKDHAKLPNWCTIMTESAEVTEALLTPDLIKAVEEAGDLLDYLVVSDQPVDKPTTLNETIPKKRIYLSTRLPSGNTYPTLPLFSYFLRLPDLLVQSARFRPEVMRKVKTTREEMVRKLQKADEEDKAEERALEREKAKKLKRELELKGLDAKGQRKYLEKEHEREQKKMMKRQTQKA